MAKLLDENGLEIVKNWIDQKFSNNTTLVEVPLHVNPSSLAQFMGLVGSSIYNQGGLYRQGLWVIRYHDQLLFVGNMFSITNRVSGAWYFDGLLLSSIIDNSNIGPEGMKPVTGLFTNATSYQIRGYDKSIFVTLT